MVTTFYTQRLRTLPEVTIGRGAGLRPWGARQQAMYLGQLYLTASGRARGEG